MRRDVAVTFDHQTLRPSVQGDDAARLAKTGVDIEPPLAHDRR
jgi:hypothetical protein